VESSPFRRSTGTQSTHSNQLWKQKETLAVFHEEVFPATWKCALLHFVFSTALGGVPAYILHAGRPITGRIFVVVGLRAIQQSSFQENIPVFASSRDSTRRYTRYFPSHSTDITRLLRVWPVRAATGPRHLKMPIITDQGPKSGVAKWNESDDDLHSSSLVTHSSPLLTCLSLDQST
jgi:hypothetical protein